MNVTLPFFKDRTKDVFAEPTLLVKSSGKIRSTGCPFSRTEAVYVLFKFTPFISFFLETLEYKIQFIRGGKISTMPVWGRSVRRLKKQVLLPPSPPKLFYFPSPPVFANAFRVRICVNYHMATAAAMEEGEGRAFTTTLSLTFFKRLPVFTQKNSFGFREREKHHLIHLQVTRAINQILISCNKFVSLSHGRIKRQDRLRTKALRSQCGTKRISRKLPTKPTLPAKVVFGNFSSMIPATPKLSLNYPHYTAVAEETHPFPKQAPLYPFATWNPDHQELSSHTPTVFSFYLPTHTCTCTYTHLCHTILSLFRVQSRGRSKHVT